MNDKCFEIGTIQAFLDGEATPELSFRLTEHTGRCDSCAFLLAEAEDETARVFGALDREFNTLVPTHRLWSNINDAIANEKGRVSFWDKARAFISPLFARPSLTAAASLLVVVGLFAFLWNLGPVDFERGSNDTETPPVVASVLPNSPTAPPNVVEQPSSPATVNTEVRETKLPPAELNRLVVNAKHNTGAGRARPQYLVDEYLPGEATYVRTIDSLKENVDSRKDIILDPSARIAYERDIAVVNDSIKRMKEIVRKDPKNQAAKQVLYSSYQNKIDLLNSVVDREELMATLQ